MENSLIVLLIMALVAIVAALLVSKSQMEEGRKLSTLVVLLVVISASGIINEYLRGPLVRHFKYEINLEKAFRHHVFTMNEADFGLPP